MTSLPSTFNSLQGDAFDREHFQQLAVRLRLLPYKTESEKQATDLHDLFISKTIAATTAKDMDAIVHWGVEAMQEWSVLRRPMERSRRAAVVQFYYKLTLTPGLKRKHMRSFTGYIRQICQLEGDGRRLLNSKDLTLDWQPLWQRLKSEIFTESSTTAQLIDLAGACNEFFLADEIPKMLEAFLPLLNPETPTLVAVILAAFLPTSKPQLYFPLVFQMGEAFSSILMWLYLMETVSAAAEHEMIFSNPKTEFKDVGIFTESQWQFLVSRTLTGYLSHMLPFDTLVRADRQSSILSKLRKPQYQPDAIAILITYSMSVDGPVKLSADAPSENGTTSPGFLGGSRALDSLAQFIVAKELLFHPSSAPPMSRSLTAMTEALSRRFIYRWTEEEANTCTTPKERRLTHQMKRAFVDLLCTPILMAIFSKDGDTASRARATLRSLAYLEPDIVMPAFLERAYNGLETVNETHRTTAVLLAMSEVNLPLVSEQVWFGGQRHILPLLELCLPGIDLNDPAKTVATANFVASVLLTVPIMSLVGKVDSGDLALPLVVDSTGELSVTASEDREEERTIVVESTGLFEDWVVSFLDRCMSLFETLPEEGGRSKKTGGKQEEVMLGGLREAVDVLCSQLSDEIFKTVLNRVYDYAVSNTKLNSMKAFSQLVRRVARTHPQATLKKFMPHCVRQIKLELEHGAASVPTTSTLESVPSDTALLWQLSILQATLVESGSAILEHRDTLLDLVPILVQKVKNERAYSLTGSIIKTIFYALTAVYTTSRRSLTNEEWAQAANDRGSQRKWGKFYQGHEVTVDWHVPSTQEIAFTLELLDKLTAPSLKELEGLIKVNASLRDKIWRNNWCRHMNVVASSWRGLDTIIELSGKDVLTEVVQKEYDVPELQSHPFLPLASLCLTNKADPRYQKVFAHRQRFGILLRTASHSFQMAAAEDHIDAVSSVINAIDTYLFHHGIKDEVARRKRTAFDSSRRAWVFNRRQYDMPRYFWTKFAECDHNYRLQHLARCRPYSEIDKGLVQEVLEFSRSPYLKVRKTAQGLAHSISNVSEMHSEFVVSKMLDVLRQDLELDRSSKTVDRSDRIKGALHTLRLGNMAGLAVNNPILCKLFFITLLDLQYHDKNSIQQLITTVFNLGIHALRQEVPLILPDTPAVTEGIKILSKSFPKRDRALEKIATNKLSVRFTALSTAIQASFLEILSIAQRPTTHWRYAEMALNALTHMRSREIIPPQEYVRYLAKCTVHTHPTIRSGGRSGLDMVFWHIQIRTYCKNPVDLWTAQGHCELHREVKPQDTQDFMEKATCEVTTDNGELYFDGPHTFCFGWVLWDKVFGHIPQTGDQPFEWHKPSQPLLEEVRTVLQSEGYFTKLIEYFAEEPNVDPTVLDARDDCVRFIERIGEVYGSAFLVPLFDAIEPLWKDENRFKQRACLEVLSGIVCGSKHWGRSATDEMWAWIMERWPTIYQNIKPDTLFWESFISWCFTSRDPRRSQPLVKWLLSLDPDFQTDSAFSLKKQLRFLANFYHGVTPRYFAPQAERLLAALFENIHTPFEVAQRYIALLIGLFIQYDWRPSYKSIDDFLVACEASDDAFHTRRATYRNEMDIVVNNLSRWRAERLPPPHALQSNFDRAAATIMQTILVGGTLSSFHVFLPYVSKLLPEIVGISEITDNPILSALSNGTTRMMISLPFPTVYIRPLFNSLVDIFQSSSSWRVRQRASSLIPAVYLRYLERWSGVDAPKIFLVMLKSLEDENVEVRNTTSVNLALVIRSSMKGEIGNLQKKFVKQARKAVLPARSSPEFEVTLRKRHGAVLGLISLARSYPFTVPEWMPGLIEVLSKFATEPMPISTAIRTFGQEFQRNHQDNWHADSKLFNEDQTLALSTIVSGTSYYA